MKAFSDVLNAALEAQERTNAWLSNKTGINPTSIGDYRNGKTIPAFDKAILIAKVLNIDLSEVFGPEEVKEAQGQYQVKTDDGIDQILRKERMVEAPLFTETRELLSALNQNGRSIDTTMAKGTMRVIERLEHDGLFVAKVDELFDCDDNFEFIIIWPWEKAVKQGQSILFTQTNPKELFVRKVLVYSEGRFVFQNQYQGSFEVEESSINILGIVAGRIELFV